MTTTRKLLLYCGPLSSLLYLARNIVFPMFYEGYSSASWTISELSAIGAPTRPYWVPLGHVYTVLVIAFGWGVWTSAGKSRRLRVVGGLMIAYGLSGFAWPFASMHQREVLAAGGGTDADVIHIVIGTVTGVIYLASLLFGAGAFGKPFRVYTFATLAAFLISGTLMGLDGPKVGKNLPTPWIGVSERIMIGVLLLWMVVLAIAILRGEREEKRL